MFDFVNPEFMGFFGCHVNTKGGILDPISALSTLAADSDREDDPRVSSGQVSGRELCKMFPNSSELKLWISALNLINEGSLPWNRAVFRHLNKVNLMVSLGDNKLFYDTIHVPKTHYINHSNEIDLSSVKQVMRASWTPPPVIGGPTVRSPERVTEWLVDRERNLIVPKTFGATKLQGFLGIKGYVLWGKGKWRGLFTVLRTG